jgi:hypothetical protein
MSSGPKPAQPADRVEKAAKSRIVRRSRRISSLSFSAISIEPLVLEKSACVEPLLISVSPP